MPAPSSQLLIRGGGGGDQPTEETPARNIAGPPIPKSTSTFDPIKCISLLNLDCTKRAAGENLSSLYDHWREEQKVSAWRIERQLRVRWALDDLIDSQLARFNAHYNRSMIPAKPSDIARLLFPSWNPPAENAAVSWLGDWRPSSILSLIPHLLCSSPLSPPAHRALAEATRRLRVQEAVIDEEMAEYQSTCVLNLPFGRRRRSRRRRKGKSSDVVAIVGEMRKMEGVMGRVQQMRYRAMEVAVKGVLDRTQAAEFFVAFAGMQDSVQRVATRWKARTGTVSITVQAFDATQ